MQYTSARSFKRWSQRALGAAEGPMACVSMVMAQHRPGFPWFFLFQSLWKTLALHLSYWASTSRCNFQKSGPDKYREWLKLMTKNWYLIFDSGPVAPFIICVWFYGFHISITCLLNNFTVCPSTNYLIYTHYKILLCRSYINLTQIIWN